MPPKRVRRPYRYPQQSPLPQYIISELQYEFWRRKFNNRRGDTYFWAQVSRLLYDWEYAHNEY